MYSSSALTLKYVNPILSPILTLRSSAVHLLRKISKIVYLLGINICQMAYPISCYQSAMLILLNMALYGHRYHSL